MLTQNEMLKAVRGFMLKTTAELSDDQLLKTPEGFNNNILWNLGHVVSSHQGLVYARQGLDKYTTEEFTNNFKNGSSPADWSSTPDIEQVKALMVELPEKFEADLAAGKFANYTPWEIVGKEIATCEQAENFNNFHEGVHYGSILALKKFV